ncbi:hypothetical protein N0V86_005710 [Didymella sp. IMI 355093]|nr:hypothetical protein N0V86_005710 [Didymella sp. IMI 355093]
MGDDCDYSTSLPFEVHRILLNFLRNSDLKSARLVNKQWSGVAATVLVLWHHLAVDPAKPAAGSPSLDALLDSHPKWFLDNIRVVTITNKMQSASPPGPAARRVASNLLRLICSLPRDGLRRFKSQHYKLDSDILLLLLRTQSHISDLTFYLDEDEQCGLLRSATVRENLERLRKLDLLVDRSYQGLVEWFMHAPVLQSLYIEGNTRDGGIKFLGWAATAGFTQLKLRSLKFGQMDLANFAPDGIAESLDLAFLESVIFEHCVSAGPLLRSMARGYKAANTSCLTNFVHAATQIFKDECRAAEELFESVGGLKSVISYCTEDSLSDLKCLKRSGQSLRLVNFLAVDKDQAYSPSELEELVSTCNRLDKIRLSLFNFSVIVDQLGPFEPYNLAAFEGLEESLCWLVIQLFIP